jgi:hypothetical protein
MYAEAVSKAQKESEKIEFESVQHSINDKIKLAKDEYGNFSGFGNRFNPNDGGVDLGGEREEGQTYGEDFGNLYDMYSDIVTVVKKDSDMF